MFDDDESPVVRHEIALKTHHEGHTPMEHLVLGSERQVTIALDGNNWLHDGDSYYAIVTGCNAAGHCSSSRTPDLLVDSTPPHLGGFKAPMNWKKFRDNRGITITNISLTWYGFYDQESDIEAYYITMSRKYSGQELSNGVVTIQNDGHGREIQTSIFLTEQLLPNEKIIVSLWAQNNVGLNSSVARVSVNVLQSSSSHEVENDWGSLEIEKHSCDVHFCNNDCTCAIIGRPCVDSNTILECMDISNTEALLGDWPTFTVSAGLKHQSLSISASSACLAGHWVPNKRGKLNNTVERFEWSIGMYEHVVGEGVFDVQSKTPWHDIGLRWEFVHCLPINKSFLHDEKYAVYLKVWYGPTTFAVFSSSPVTIDLTPPIINRGKFIMEGASCIKDEDFLQWTDNITICWKGVFSDLQSGIHHYSISVGTAPESKIFCKCIV
ncbi:hypothetical protein DPMN_175860 [Dreissena polymorpha]|uniref:Uncharacterized protein n=1 Tax=Dreissena polymorpha TaxID=45954 RepID=A0A9D4E818_DREPO|nr:hypothetical protein DPMN_175860 [Dreissena polymorpha]